MSDIASPPVTEIRLSGPRASAAQIARTVHRHLRSAGLARVEVAYSTQTSPAITQADIRAVLAPYMSQVAAAKTPVSIRRHSNPLDDAAGEHVVRLIYGNGVQAGTRRGWLAQKFPWIAQLLGVRPQDRQVQSALEPRVSNAQAVAALKRAVQQAVQTFGRSPSPIAAADIIVYDTPIHNALGGLVSDSAALSQWLAHQLRANGAPVAPRFTATYVHRPVEEGDGTMTVLAGDVEVNLRAASARESYVEPFVGDPDATALPTHLVHTAGPPTVIAAVVAVGTTPLPRPFAFELGDRTTLDREFFAGTAFGKAHPDLLATISRQIGLSVTPVSMGVKLGARAHPATGQAVYYLLAPDGSTQPITVETLVNRLPARVYLNAPAGVAARDGQRTLPPVVIELRDATPTVVNSLGHGVDPDATLLPGA